MELEIVRDKLGEYLLLWELGNLRRINRFYSTAQLRLNLFRVPRVVKYKILLFLPDEWDSDPTVTECEQLALVCRGCCTLIIQQR